MTDVYQLTIKISLNRSYDLALLYLAKMFNIRCSHIIKPGYIEPKNTNAL